MARRSRLIVAPTGTVSGSNKDLIITGDLINHGDITLTGRDITMSGATKTLGGSGGTFTLDATKNLIVSGGNKTIASSAILTIDGAGINYSDVVVTNNGNITINGTMTDNASSTWTNSDKNSSYLKKFNLS